MRDLLRRLLDALLGPLCTCGQRVFPKDRARHQLDHTPEGDPT